MPRPTKAEGSKISPVPRHELRPETFSKLAVVHFGPSIRTCPLQPVGMLSALQCAAMVPTRETPRQTFRQRRFANVESRADSPVVLRSRSRTRPMVTSKAMRMLHENVERAP